MRRRTFLEGAAAVVTLGGAGLFPAGSEALRRKSIGPRVWTSDITLFLAAKRVAGASPASERAAIYQRLYLDKGSVGLKDFVAGHRLENAATLAKQVDATPRYYASLTTLPRRIDAMRPTFAKVFAGLRDLYPQANVPDLYFVIGHFRSSGTVTSNGMLIGAEVWAVSPETPTDEFPGKRRSVIHLFKDMPYNVAHELVHTQQALEGKDTLLERAIFEGTAEMVAEKLVPNSPILPMRAWADAHERFVWERFNTQMAGTDGSDWLANNDRETPDWPAALGYYVGYQIARAYYERTADKRAAIRTLFELNDARAVLDASGYADRFR